MAAGEWFTAYLAVGIGFLVLGVYRGLYDLSKQTVTVLHPGGRRETKESREVPEFLVTVAISVFVWPIFPAFWIIQRVMQPILRRRSEQRLRDAEDR